jgi:hypothetical protein
MGSYGRPDEELEHTGWVTIYAKTDAKKSITIVGKTKLLAMSVDKCLHLQKFSCISEIACLGL